MVLMMPCALRSSVRVSGTVASLVDIGSVGDAHALVGEEVEQLVLLDGAAERGAELIAVQERHLLA